MAATGPLLHLGAAPGRARALCVFVHGRGQSAAEMEATVIKALDLPGVRFTLPDAPGGSWYAARAIDPLTDATRDALAASLAQLRAVIAGARAEAPGVPLLLAGFSQGACLSLEHVFAGQDAPDAVAAFTGCRVGVAGDDRPGALPYGLPAYLTGGDADPWIPVSAFAGTAAELGQGGAALRADMFPGRAHEVSAPERAMLAAMLTDLSARRPIRFEAPR